MGRWGRDREGQWEEVLCGGVRDHERARERDTSAAVVLSVRYSVINGVNSTPVGTIASTLSLYASA
jgi:hypothetical protein